MPPRRRPNRAEMLEAEMRTALSWPVAPPPEPLGPSALSEMVAQAPNGMARAWTFNASAMRISYGSFNRFDHRDDGPMTKNAFASRGTGGPWFATRDEACLAMRHAVTVDAANLLVRADKLIADYRAMSDPSEPDQPEEAAAPRR